MLANPLEHRVYDADTERVGFPLVNTNCCSHSVADANEQSNSFIGTHSFSVADDIDVSVADRLAFVHSF